VVTMRAVADRAGVSIATVSFVVNNTKPVSPETRARIVEAIKELNYERNVLARALASQRTRIIALLYPALQHRVGPTIMNFVTQAASVAHDRGYDFVLWPVTNDADEMSRLIAGGLVDGVVLMEVQINDARVDWLVASEVPFALIGRTHDLSLPYVDIDFKKTLEGALDYLTELGHEHISFVNERTPDSVLDDLGTIVRFEEAYRDGMLARGLSPTVVYCESTPSCGRQAAADVMTANPLTTAIIVMPENAAFGLINGIRRAGLSIPADVSVMSVTMSAELAEFCDPVISTMNVPAAELGKLGVTALIDQLEGTVVRPPQVLLECGLVVGESTGPAPKSSR
jgi:DNA-binding LacI/PurR family transcriptional regulator